MSLRGVIAIENPDKTVRAIYACVSMRLAYAGDILTSHYKTAERVNRLLDAGSITVLAERINREDDYSDSIDWCWAANIDFPDGKKEADNWNSAEELLQNARDFYRAELIYLFRDGKWFYNIAAAPQKWRSAKRSLGRINYLSRTGQIKNPVFYTVKDLYRLTFGDDYEKYLMEHD